MKFSFRKTWVHLALKYISFFSDSSSLNRSSNTKAALLMFSQQYFSKAYTHVVCLSSSLSFTCIYTLSHILLLHEKMNCIYLYPISWSVRQQQNHSETFHVVYHLLIYVCYNIAVLMLLIAWITQSSFIVSIPSEISMQNGLSSKGSKWLTAWFWLFKLKFSSGSSEDCWYIIQNSEEINTSLNDIPSLLFSLH